MLFASTFLLVGCGLRCVVFNGRLYTILIHSGQFMIGLSGPAARGSSTVISCMWFPRTQRTTSTAIAAMASHVGTAISFVMGPWFVRDIKDFDSDVYSRQMAVDDVSDQIKNLIFTQSGICVVLFLLILISFPTKPDQTLDRFIKIPTERLKFKESARSLLLNPQFQMIAFIYGATSGVYNAWCSDLALNLHEFKVTDHTARWLRFWTTVAGSASGVIISM